MKEIRINLRLRTSEPDWTKTLKQFERLLELNYLDDQWTVAQAHAQSVDK